jgi:hypothetical protein
MKLWRLPKIEPSILKYRVPPLRLTYKGERRTTFAKAYGSPPLSSIKKLRSKGKMEDQFRIAWYHLGMWKTPSVDISSHHCIFLDDFLDDSLMI